MKITALLLLIAIMQVSAASYAQKINLSESNISLKKLFKEIKLQTGYDFVYSKSDLKDTKLVSINVNSGKIDDVLQQIFAEQPLTYTITNNTVVIKQKPAKILYSTGWVASTITGKVTDATGKPLPGVNILNKNTKRGTVSQSDGGYSIVATKGDVLVFSFIGFTNSETVVGNQLSIDIVLSASTSSLNDVVVVGYGTTQRKDLTGSVAIIAGKDIEDIPFTTFDNALAGKAAGVEVIKNDGSPGGAVRIRVRGSTSFLGGNDPLYVIDGVPVQATSNFQSPGYDVISPNGNAANGFNVVTNSTLATAFVNGLNSLGGLNPDDIESIIILKDASSTAIYGSKAANGVVLITTKKGKKNTPSQITATYYSTINTPNLPNLLDAAQFKTAYTQAAQNTSNRDIAAGIAVPTSVSQVFNSPSTFFGTANTDWLKLVTRNTVSNNGELSVQGGSGSSNYFNSISYTSIPGTVLSTGYQRVSGKITLSNDISSKFHLSTNLLLGYTSQNIGSNAYGQAINARPDFAPYNASGGYTAFSSIDPYQPSRMQNPLALLNIINNSKTFNLLGSLSATYDITNALQFKSTVSTNVQMYNQRNYTPSYVASVSFTASAFNNGVGSVETSTTTEWLVENTLSYNKNFDKKNSLNLLAGTSYESDKYSTFGATATGYPNDDVLTSLSSAVTPQLVSGTSPTMPQSYLISFYLRANYSYLDKYILTFTGRADGSSKFGPDNKFGYFPSGGAAWRISQEKFLKDVKWIDDIKLRGSYGLTGTQNIGDQMYRTLYSPSSYNGASVLLPSQLGNSSIKWESTLQADGGVDITLFNGRLTATVDYYNKQTNNDLLVIPIASNTSYTSLLAKVGGIKNSGWEYAIQGDIIRTNKFKWNLGVNITFNNSIVTKLNPDVSLSQLGDLTGVELSNTTLIQGQPLGLITGLTETGIIQTQAQLDAYKATLPKSSATAKLGIGDPMFKLLPNGSGFNYNSIIGHGAPKYWGGINQDFAYKNFDLQLNFTYSVGGQLLWADHVNNVRFYAPTNAHDFVLNAYSPTNTNTNLPELLIGANYYKSTLDVFSSSYIKLRSLRLNYNFNKARWVEKAGFKNVGLFASATNVFTITKYPGNDPETSDDPYSFAGGYIDVSNYPTLRTYSLGVKVSL